MQDSVLLTRDPLSLDAAHQFVSDPAAGAISTFTGTTRDNFDGKRVICLEYEAYDAMALKEMNQLCVQGRRKYASVIRIAIYHRLGVVPISEASVIIAVSSPHRAEAICKLQLVFRQVFCTRAQRHSKFLILFWIASYCYCGQHAVIFSSMN